MAIMSAACEEPTPETGGGWLAAHGDYLFNLAVGQVRDPLVAEDLVQETFLAAIKARDRFAGRSSDRTWLVGILRHKIYDHLRRVCRERASHYDTSSKHTDQEAWDDSVLWVHEVAGECLGPSRRMELAELREALELAVGKLPPRIAEVFQLYEVEERPNREVCDQLKISESNLWVMLHRARKLLRQELAGWWDGQDRRALSPATASSLSSADRMPVAESGQRDIESGMLQGVDGTISLN